jgi:parvulin-like peptidyl-prolyl isomerase
LAPPVLKALLAMKTGDVSDLIQIEQAYTIVRLGDHTPAGRAKFEDVKGQLEKELPQARKNQIRAELDKKLRETAKVETL